VKKSWHGVARKGEWICRPWVSILRCLLLLIVLIIWCRTAVAAPLPPGATVSLDGLTTLPPGVVIAEATNAYAVYTVGPSPGGDAAFLSISYLKTDVYREDSTGCLDFIYSLDAVSPAATITHLSVSGLAGIAIDAAYETTVNFNGILFPAGAQRPQSATRSIDGGFISFDAWIMPDQEVAPVTIRTTATQYVNARITVEYVVDDLPYPGDFNPGADVITNVESYVSVASSIPEPGLAGFLLAAVPLTFRSRRYLKQN